MRVVLPLIACCATVLAPACAPECASLLDCPESEVCTSDGVCVQTDAPAVRAGRVPEPASRANPALDLAEVGPPSVFPSAASLIAGRGLLWGAFGTVGTLERAAIPTESDTQLVVATEGTEAGGFIAVNITPGPEGAREVDDSYGAGVACSLNTPVRDAFDVPLDSAVVDVGDASGVVPPAVQDELLEQGFVPLVVQGSAPAANVAVIAVIAVRASSPAQ